jgi:hypothetical protein
MKMWTTTLAAAAVLAHAACDSGAPPTGPDTAMVSLRYVPPAPGASCSAPPVSECAGSCAHHGAPANLTVSTSWEEEARLASCGEAYCVQLTRVPIGREVTVLVTDIGQCCRDCTTAVRETVYANGTQLRRFREEPIVPGRAGGLAFQVNGRGVVTP